MGSKDAYVGTFVSLTTKCEIRYQGVVFEIDPQGSTLGLKDVRCFGTEGREKDGKIVPPSERVYDCIYFRESDVKDLEVLSSPAVKSAAAVPDDPAIVQSHYLQRPSKPTNLPPSGSGSVANFTSNSPVGVPISEIGITPLYIGTWGLSPSPDINATRRAVQMYWQGFIGSSAGVSHLQKQSLFQPPPALVPSPSGKWPMQYPDITGAGATSASNLPDFSWPFLPPFSANPINSTSNLIPSSGFPSKRSLNLPIGDATEAPNQMRNEPTCLPSGKPSSILPSVTGSPLSTLTFSFLDKSPFLSRMANKPKLVHDSTSSSPSVVETSGTSRIEASIPSLLNPDLFLQFGPTDLSSSHSAQAAQGDVEVVQASTSKFLSMDAKDDKAPVSLSPSHLKRSSGASLRPSIMEGPLKEEEERVVW